MMKMIDQPLGRALHVVVIGRIGADRRDTQQILQFVYKIVEVGLGVGEGVLHGRWFVVRGSLLVPTLGAALLQGRVNSSKP